MSNELEKLLTKIIIWGIYLTMSLPLAISPLLFLPDKFAKAVIFRIIVEIILIPFILLVLYNKKYRPSFNILTIAVAFFWFIGLLSTIFSQQPFMSIWGSATRGSGFFNFTHYVIFFFILMGVVRDKEQWKKIFNFAIMVAAIASIFALLQRIIPAFNPEFMNSSQNRPSGTMGNPIMLANYLVMLVFITFAFWRQELSSKVSVSPPKADSPLAEIRQNPYKSVFKRMFYFVSGLLMLGAIFTTQTRGAWLGLMGGVFFFLLFYPFKNSGFTVKKRILILFSILVIIFLLFIFNDSINIIPQRIFTLGNINRITSWQIALKAIMDRPLLGWGIDNFAIPFDKYYHGGYTTSYSGLAETWWDKAHNVPLDIGVTMGLLGLVAYLGIFYAVFRKLYKVGTKKFYDTDLYGSERIYTDDKDISVSKQNQYKPILIYAISATFIAYFVQNLTSFDSVTSYILFFTLLALVNSICIDSSKSVSQKSVSISQNPYKSVSNKSVSYNIIGVIALIIIAFIIIKVSIIPFYLNYKTNRYVIPARAGNYIETITPYREIVKKYQGKTYYEKELNEKFIKIAGHFAPAILHQIKDIEEYKKLNQEVIALLKRSIELEPYHTKHYYNTGLFYNNISAIDINFAAEGLEYFRKALELSPNREQILIEMSKLYIVLMDYDAAIENLQKVAAISPRFNETYLWLGIANLYKQNIVIGKKYLEFAREFGYNMEEMISLKMIAGVYSDIWRWEEAIPYYLKILDKDPNDITVRALLAGSYKKIGKMEEAREQAEILLRISPEAKESIEEFLKTL